MNDQDYIRAGIELADGGSEDNWSFRLVQIPEAYPPKPALTSVDNPQQWFLDALAAHLIRQANLILSKTRIDDKYAHYGDPMEPIKAIVDSGVLK